MTDKLSSEELVKLLSYWYGYYYRDLDEKKDDAYQQIMTLIEQGGKRKCDNCKKMLPNGFFPTDICMACTEILLGTVEMPELRTDIETEELVEYLDSHDLRFRGWKDEEVYAEIKRRIMEIPYKPVPRAFVEKWAEEIFYSVERGDESKITDMLTELGHTIEEEK